MSKWTWVLSAACLVMAMVCWRLLGPRSGDGGDRKIPVVFLYDDVSGQSRTDLERTVIEAFKRHGISCTFVVIPFVCVAGHQTPCDEGGGLGADKIDMLRNALRTGALEVGLHGYSQQNIHASIPGASNEFAGLTYDEQFRKMRRGKEYLESILGTGVNTFMPTFNSYDGNTLKSLGGLGFGSISEIEYGVTDGNAGLEYVAVTCAIQELKQAVSSARRMPGNGAAIVSLIRSPDVGGGVSKDGTDKHQEFAGIIDWTAAQKDLRVSSIRNATREKGSMDAARFDAYSSYLKFSRYLYPMIPQVILRNVFPMGVYLPEKAAREIKFELCAFVLSLYCGVFAVAAVLARYAGRMMLRRSRFMFLMCRFAFAALLVIAAVYALWRMDFDYNQLSLEMTAYYWRPYYRSAMALVVLGGINVVWLTTVPAGQRSWTLPVSSTSHPHR